MMNKRGWIRILEATIAVLIVSGVMISVYSDQSVREDITVRDYSYSLQKEILSDISFRTDLRLNALAVEEDLPGDPNYDILNSFVNDSIPDSFGYLLRVCDLGDTSDFCKMDSSAFIATLDRDVFVEEVVISAELGGGEGDEIYSPKKVRLFFWEGGLPEDFCRDECSSEGVSSVCSADFTQVLSASCADSDGDGCLESVGSAIVETCGTNEFCVDAECVFSDYSEWTCEREVVTDMGCVDDSLDATICSGFDIKREIGGCDCGIFGCDGDFTQCIDMEEVGGACSDSPICPSGYTFVSAAPCVAPTVASLSAVYAIGVKTGNNYYYNVTLTEANGVAVNIDSGRRCLSSTGLCQNFSPTFVVPADGEVIRINQYFTTPSIPDTATYTYFGTDVNSNPVEIGFSISTSEY